MDHIVYVGTYKEKPQVFFQILMPIYRSVINSFMVRIKKIRSIYIQETTVLFKGFKIYFESILSRILNQVEIMK